MSTFPPCLLIVTAEIEASEEAAWNRWYDDVHLPDALACPGVLAGARYISEGDAALTDKGTRTLSSAVSYTTIYELEGPEALETAEFKAMRGWDRFTAHITSKTQVYRHR